MFLKRNKSWVGFLGLVFSLLPVFLLAVEGSFLKLSMASEIVSSEMKTEGVNEVPVDQEDLDPVRTRHRTMNDNDSSYRTAQCKLVCDQNCTPMQSGVCVSECFEICGSPIVIRY